MISAVLAPGVGVQSRPGPEKSDVRQRKESQSDGWFSQTAHVQMGFSLQCPLKGLTLQLPQRVLDTSQPVWNESHRYYTNSLSNCQRLSYVRVNRHPPWAGTTS